MPHPQNTVGRIEKHTGHQKLEVLEEELTGETDAFEAFTGTIPAYAEVVRVRMTYVTAIVIATGVKLGVGLAADPDQFLLSGTTVTINAKNKGLVPFAGRVVGSSAITPRITALDTNGDAAGTWTSGTVRCRIEYRRSSRFGDLPD